MKTDADLSQVVAWHYANSREILESRIPIPAILHKRLSIDWSDKENRPPLSRASGMIGHDVHWLDQLGAGVKNHIQAMQTKRDEPVAQVQPPPAVLDEALADPGAVKLGAGLNQRYAAALHMGKKHALIMTEGGQHSNVMEWAKAAAEGYLAYIRSERRSAILLGALASVDGNETTGSDAAVWLAGVKGGGDTVQPGIGVVSVARLTVEADLSYP